MKYTSKTCGFAAILLTSLPTVLAHTWIDDMHVIGRNGTLIGASGYPRGYLQRTAGVDPDAAMVWLLPPNDAAHAGKILATDAMCKPSQSIGSQTSGSPSLIAAPGDNVALRYQENGHVTLPQNQPGKPDNRGTIYIYGTQKPSNSDTLLEIHKVWNAEGTGGDGRGVLLATRNFDDGQCYQVNDGTISTQRQAQFPHTAEALMGVNLWCQSDFQIPTTISTSSPLTIYWVWDWPTAAGTAGVPDGKPEIYTTCMDITLSGSTDNVVSSSNPVSFIEGQDLNIVAIASELTVQFDVTGSSTVDTYTTATSGASSAADTNAAASTTSTQTSVKATRSAAASSANEGGVFVGSSLVAPSVATGIVATETVTVTDTTQAAKVTVTVTKTASASAKATSSSSSSSSSASHPAVQPFFTTSVRSSSSVTAKVGAATSSSSTDECTSTLRIRGRAARREARLAAANRI
jgi:hypothetical protein